MRRKYVYDETTKEMVEVTLGAQREQTHYIQPDIQPFVSPADGTIIKSRTHLKRYMKAKNLAHYDDFKDTQGKRISEREKFYQGKDRASVEARARSLSDSFEHHRNQAIARSRYG